MGYRDALGVLKQVVSVRARISREVGRDLRARPPAVVGREAIEVGRNL
jgi:hypothetical protein